MRTQGFRRKPSPSHIIWARGGQDTDGVKRFDVDHFERWATHCGFEFDRSHRVDHDRGAEPRTQHRVVFSWGKTAGETLTLGDDEWSMGPQTSPRTFIEIDDAGCARVKGWTFETTLDVVEMRHKGPNLLLTTADGDKKRLNARKFVSNPREQQREGD